MPISFSELEKNCKQSTCGMPRGRLAVLGDCATQHLATAVRGYAFREGLALEVFDAGYNQIDAQLLDEHSELSAFQPEAVLLYRCTEKLYEAFCERPQGEKTAFAELQAQRIVREWERARRRCPNAVLIPFNFAQRDDGVFGNFAAKTPASFAFQLRELNVLLAREAAAARDVFPVDLDRLQSLYGAQTMRDEKMYLLAKLPLSLRFLPVLAAEVCHVIGAVRGSVKKCVVCDLDNTLWGGVIGDDGLDGIELGELGQGPAFVRLQRWLRELKRRGILLAVCSKNEEAAAKAPFLQHPDMVLRLEDFAAFAANWEDKAVNLRRLQQALNIGMDSIVFLDDNPFERERARSLPGLTVPELPEDPAQYVPYLESLGLFETASYSTEDEGRTLQYRTEAQRRALEADFSSYDDYLAGLSMTAQAKPFDSFHFARIAQLSQRSNQFNLRTVRYTEAQVAALAQNPDVFTLYFTLRDTFGDYGLIGVAVLEKQSADALFVSQWLMSCRVLKRGMEEFIADALVRTAKENGFARVIGEYLPTAKNAMVAELYPAMGFEKQKDGRFEAEVSRYRPHNTRIEREKTGGKHA